MEMNRTLFIASFIILIITGNVFIQYEFLERYAFLVVFFGGIIITMLRRYYLGMNPWWGSRGKDVIKYFSEP